MTMSAKISNVMGAATILENDPYGLIVALISTAVVLLALISLAIIISIFSKIVVSMSQHTAEEAAPEQAESPSVDAGANGEIIAAIALAMKLYQEDLHDKESEIITINTVARAYSPWNSKIHGLTDVPRK